MARGWESKEVESQIEQAEERRTHRDQPKEFTSEELAAAREHDGIEVSRNRILQELERASHPRHRAMLEESLRHLEGKLAAFAEAHPDVRQIGDKDISLG